MCLALLKMTLGHDETAILKQKPGVLQTFGSFFIKNTAKIGRGSWSVCPLASTYLSMPRELVPSSLTIGRILDLDRLSNYWIKILKIFTQPYSTGERPPRLVHRHVVASLDSRVRHCFGASKLYF